MCNSIELLTRTFSKLGREESNRCRDRRQNRGNRVDQLGQPVKEIALAGQRGVKDIGLQFAKGGHEDDDHQCSDVFGCRTRHVALALKAARRSKQSPCDNDYQEKQREIGRDYEVIEIEIVLDVESKHIGVLCTGRAIRKNCQHGRRPETARSIPRSPPIPAHRSMRCARDRSRRWRTDNWNDRGYAASTAFHLPPAGWCKESSPSSAQARPSKSSRYSPRPTPSTGNRRGPAPPLRATLAARRDRRLPSGCHRPKARDRQHSIAPGATDRLAGHVPRLLRILPFEVDLAAPKYATPFVDQRDLFAEDFVE